MKNRYWIVGVLGTLLAGLFGGGASAQSQPAQHQNAQSQTAQKSTARNQKKASTKKGVDTSGSAEPDKVLYERALFAIKKSRYIEGRLDLQTLINTYPDSEYLAKAKLSVADSYYKEGGVSNLTQAISEYQDFITFFPFLDEAAYAQLQVGMAYYHMMEKADRDKSDGEQAENALQAFILKYPQTPLVPKAEQQLRNVQEILADGQFRTARFYYLKQDYRPAAARLLELTERYPLYSLSDNALWMLGDVYSRAKQASKSEDDKNHWADLAGQCYGRIVEYYPESKLVPEAKSRLKAMNLPVPAANPDAVARMKQEQLYDRQHAEHGWLHLPTGTVFQVLGGTPDFSAAAHFGVPNLQPPDDNVSALEVLRPGAGGPDFSLSARQIPTADETSAQGGGDATPTENLGTSDVTPSAASSVGAEIISTGGAASDPGASAPSGSNSPSNTLPTPLTPTSDPAAAPSDQSVLPTPLAPSAGSTPATTDSAAGTVATPSSPTPQAGSGASAPQQEAQQAEAAKADSSTESTSKKKKGLHKLIPF